MGIFHCYVSSPEGNMDDVELLQTLNRVSRSSSQVMSLGYVSL